MEIILTHYTTEQGWQSPLPDFDSTQTLVLIFGDSDLHEQRQPFEELLTKHPSATIAVGVKSIEGKGSSSGLMSV